MSIPAEGDPLEGEAYLRIVGFDKDTIERFRTETFFTENGTEYRKVDYFKICGPAVRATIAGVLSLPEPTRQENLNALREGITARFDHRQGT